MTEETIYMPVFYCLCVQSSIDVFRFGNSLDLVHISLIHSCLEGLKVIDDGTLRILRSAIPIVSQPATNISSVEKDRRALCSDAREAKGWDDEEKHCHPFYFADVL